MSKEAGATGKAESFDATAFTAGMKVDEEAAELEVKRFLDLKRISESKREHTFDQNIKDLIRLVQSGALKFDFEKKRASYRLQVPLVPKSSAMVESIEMRFFIGVNQAFNSLKDVEIGAVDERALCMVSALSGIPRNILKNSENELGDKGLDTSDHASLRSYALFFLA